MEFSTSNLDLAAFLLLEDEIFLRLEDHPNKTGIVRMVFEDPFGKCLDLERLFITSKFKSYREWHRWLLQKVKSRTR